MATEFTHTDEGVLHIVLSDVPDVIWVQVGSTVGSLDHSAIFINIMLEQPILHLVGRQEVCINNSVD